MLVPREIKSISGMFDLPTLVHIEGAGDKIKVLQNFVSEIITFILTFETG